MKSLNLAGDFELQAGNTSAADGYFEEAFSIAQWLLDSSPNDARIRADAAELMFGFAKLRSDRGDDAGAIEMYEAVRSICARLLRTDPHSEWINGMLARAGDRIARIRLDEGETDAARLSISESIEIYRRMRRRDPLDLGVALDLGGALLTAARIAEADGRTGEALTLARQGLDALPEDMSDPQIRDVRRSLDELVARLSSQG